MANRWTRWGVALAAAVLLAAGCSKGRGDLLVVATGDCQGYLEPCG